VTYNTLWYSIKRSVPASINLDGLGLTSSPKPRVSPVCSPGQDTPRLPWVRERARFRCPRRRSADVGRRRTQGRSGESVAVIAHGDHVCDVVASGELARLRETIQVLSDVELVRELQEGLADARAGRVFSAGHVAADLADHQAADP
jgi:hypothetical protein